MVETEESKVEYDENGKRCGYALYKNQRAGINFEGTFLDDKWEGLVIMTNFEKAIRNEQEFKADERTGVSTYYEYKKQYIDKTGRLRQLGLVSIENSKPNGEQKGKANLKNQHGKQSAVKKINNSFYFKGKFMNPEM